MTRPTAVETHRESVAMKRKLRPADLARRAPQIPDLRGAYDWRRQIRDYGETAPVAFKMSTQTFGSGGRPKDSDKDYD